MNDTNDDANATDQRVIDRLRAALDEVAADSGDGLVVMQLRPATDTRRRWLGVAAATVLIAGGAAWALAQRDATSPVAAPDTSAGVTTVDIDVAPATTVTIGMATSTPVTTLPPAADPPWFTLAWPALVALGNFQQEPVPLDEQVLFQSWRVSDGERIGFITVVVRDDVSPGVEGDYTVEELAVTDGVAYFLRPNADNAPMDHGFELRWFRGDGSAWLFQSQGLDRDALVGLLLQAVPGSGVPIVIPGDPTVTLLTVGTLSGASVTQDYSNGGEIEPRHDGTDTVRLRVVPDGSAMHALIGAATIVDVTVAGLPGHAAQLDDGRTEVAWDAGGGWWGTLSIGSLFAPGADGIIAAVVHADPSSPPATPVAPLADVQLYRTFATVVENADHTWGGAYELLGTYQITPVDRAAA